MNPFETLPAEPTKWITLLRSVEAALDSLPGSPWKPAIVPLHAGTIPQDYIAASIWEIQKDHLDELTKAAVHLVRTGQWPSDLSPQAAYFLHLSCSSIGLFLSGICYPVGGISETIFPFPAGDEKTVLLWFLTSWWANAGFHLYLGELRRRAAPLPYDVGEL